MGRTRERGGRDLGRAEEGKSVTQHTDGAWDNEPAPETIAITGCSTSEEMGKEIKGPSLSDLGNCRTQDRE